VIARETDPDTVNAIANRPGIREFIDYRDDKSIPLDFTPAVGRITTTGIVWLTDGNGALAAFEQVGDRAYNVHLMFESRGRAAVQAGRDMVEYLRPYADEIWGLIPQANKAARWFARQMGAAHAYDVHDPAMGECEALVWKAA
jgi:hypothetical protein